MQAHTVPLRTRGLCNFTHCSFFPSSPQSIPCPVLLPHTGRKCSLKASPPTTPAPRSQSATENTPSYNDSNSLPSTWMCTLLHSEVPMLQSLVVWMRFTIKQPYIYTLTRRSVETDVRGEVTVSVEGPMALPLTMSCGTPLKRPIGL